MVEHALEVSRGLIEARKHALEVALPPDEIVLHADLTRLAQVFANLLNNAAKFTEPGGHIRLEAELERGELAIRVRDNGDRHRAEAAAPGLRPLLPVRDRARTARTAGSASA